MTEQIPTSISKVLILNIELHFQILKWILEKIR